MKDRIWPFVIGNNLFPIALIALSIIVYLKYARPTTSNNSPEIKTPVAAPVPKYVEKIIEKHHYLPATDSKIEYLPKTELEKERPGSVAPAVLQDNTSEIVARTEIPASRGPTQVDAIRLERPGQPIRYRLDYRPLPGPFFDLKKEFHMGIYLGKSTNGETLVESELRVLPLRIGSYETIVKGRAGYGDRDGFYGAVLIGVEY